MIPLKTATSISLKTPLTSCSSSFKKKGSFHGTLFLSLFWSLFLLQYFSLKLLSHGFSNSPPPSFSFFPLKNLCFFSSFLYLPPIHSIAPTIILWRCLEKKKKKSPSQPPPWYGGGVLGHVSHAALSTWRSRTPTPPRCCHLTKEKKSLLNRGLQICPSLVELTSEKHVNIEMKWECE